MHRIIRSLVMLMFVGCFSVDHLLAAGLEKNVTWGQIKVASDDFQPQPVGKIASNHVSSTAEDVFFSGCVNQNSTQCNPEEMFADIHGTRYDDEEGAVEFTLKMAPAELRKYSRLALEYNARAGTRYILKLESYAWSGDDGANVTVKFWIRFLPSDSYDVRFTKEALVKNDVSGYIKLYGIYREPQELLFRGRTEFPFNNGSFEGDVLRDFVVYLDDASVRLFVTMYVDVPVEKYHAFVFRFRYGNGTMQGGGHGASISFVGYDYMSYSEPYHGTSIQDALTAIGTNDPPGYLEIYGIR